MKHFTVFIRVAIVSLVVIVSCEPPTSLAKNRAHGTLISPVSLSANVPGLKITQKLFERLLVRTELTTLELNNFGIKVGDLDENDLKNVLEWEQESPTQFIRFFDDFVGDANNVSSVDWAWLATIGGFINDSVLYGGLDSSKEAALRESLKNAKKPGDNSKQIEARSRAHQLLQEVRHTIVRTARGHRRLIDELSGNFKEREIVRNIGLIVELRTKAKRPMYSPLMHVDMHCKEKLSGEINTSELIFYERGQKCDKFGICRVEFSSTVSEGLQDEILFNKLAGPDGRKFLDSCFIKTQMLIDGVEVSRKLPGKFTSHIAAPFNPEWKSE